jgi:pimeloyl-[acyl-carrier protein] methyl ester esterase
MKRWLMLRGLGRRKEHWFGFKDQLAAQSDEVLCLDLPGFGERDDETSPLTIAGIVEAVRADFIAKKGLPGGEWNVVSISLSGMVTLEWISRYPKDFRGVVIMNTSSRDVGAVWQRLSPFGLFKLSEAAVKPEVEDRERAILEMILNLKKGNQKILRDHVALANERPVKITNFLRQLAAASMFVAPETVSTPLLFLASQKDHMVDVRCSKALAERLHATIKFHPEAGHELPLEDPDWCLKQIVAWANA